MSLQTQLQALREELAAVAQDEYDGWEQTEPGGGICDEIAARMASVIAEHVDVDVLDAGQDGDDHAWLVVIDHESESAVGIDIAPHHYEHGGGYLWTRLADVTFTAEMVDVFDCDYELMRWNEDFDSFYSG